ncbi:uncharacterized protein [Melanerpes formicivorus]|uniref:uncharacterized protein isoform X2 n=1 Tax=Melanerpes formicivorus TaxID=211600 RepID=UPI00358F2BB1
MLFTHYGHQGEDNSANFALCLPVWPHLKRHGECSKQKCQETLTLIEEAKGGQVQRVQRLKAIQGATFWNDDKNQCFEIRMPEKRESMRVPFWRVEQVTARQGPILTEVFHLPIGFMLDATQAGHLILVMKSRSVLFSIFVYNLDEGIKCTLKFRDHTKLGGFADTPEGWQSFSEIWIDWRAGQKNLMRFNKSKRGVQHLGRNNTMHQ